MLKGDALVGQSMHVSGDVAQAAVEHLLEWQAADEPELAWQKIRDWRQVNQQHEHAWQQIERVNAKIGLLAEKAEPGVAHASLTTQSITRREALKSLSLLFVVGGTGVLAHRQQPWQSWFADYQTASGQQQRITLDDGTAITLNSDTAIDVRYTDNERRVVLVKGELYVRTATVSSDEAVRRPFIVEVASGELRPLGTRFSARVLPNSCRVAVYQGRVQIQAAEQEKAVIIDSGHSMVFSKTKLSSIQTATEAEAAWIQGMVSANGMRLQDFLIELSRHRSGIIQCDPAVADLKVSGTYPINKVDRVLYALPQSLPIEVQTFTRYWVRVAPAS